MTPQKKDGRFPSGPTQQHGSRYVYIVWRAAGAFSGLGSRGRERLRLSSYFFIKKKGLSEFGEVSKVYRDLETDGEQFESLF